MRFKEYFDSLQADTKVIVYHGTDLQTAYNFCIGGIDAKKPQRYRIFPHISGGKNLKFGIFVAPDPKTSLKFGRYALEFPAIGKDLIYKFPVEMKNSNELLKKQFPNSFRPTVSDDLINNPIEPQALFIGLVHPESITKVYYLEDNNWNKMKSISREEFVEIAKTQKVKEMWPIFHPTDYKISLADFVKRLAAEHNSTEEEILKILKEMYKKHGYLTGIGDVPYSVLKRIERQLSRIS